jgi:CRISPR-associated endonuclease/helicase Cas3
MFFNTDLSNHGEIGAYFFLTDYFNENLIINLILFRIIKKHHGNLINFIDETQYLIDDDRLKTISSQIEHYSLPLFSKIYKNIEIEKWQNIKSLFQSSRKINKLFPELIKEKNLKYFFFQHFMYSLLLSADKGDVSLDNNSVDIIKENRLIPADVVDNYKLKIINVENRKAIDIEREEAYNHVYTNLLKNWSERIFSITLPTGLGKTFAAYNAAIKLQNLIHKEKGYCPRIIYCLPFTSIIDQNTLVLLDILAKNGIPLDFVSKNHYLSTYNDCYDKKELSDNEAEYLADGWEKEFVVTTFVQLLESIFTNRNKSIRKFHNMANAIIILDEVQNIPAKYIEIVRETFLKMAEYFETKFILVSATQPIIFKYEEITELTDPTLVKTEEFFHNRNRIELDQALFKANNYKPMERDDLLQLFKDSINENTEKSILIICNTIAQSQFYFDDIKKSYTESCVIYLSSSILPKRRKQIIKLIKRNIANKKRMILVSTQVIEAGVDIDFDIVFRDFAPLDNINQSAGRCNRNGIRDKGVVKLFNSGKASNIYDPIMLNITERILKEYENEINENQFYSMNRKYFTEVWKNIAENNDKSINLRGWMESLQMEEIQKNFKLIEQDLRHYNVFVPYCGHARKIWKKYQECFEKKDFFERKHAIKKIKPEVLMYTTKFPKNKYEPEDSKADNFLIYEENWQNYYDLNSGFKVKEDETIIII